MSASSSNSIKWVCSLCTYENWPASQKCTICGTLKQSNTSDPQTASCISSSESSLLEPDRWSCSLCTYFNYSKSRFCTQCKTQNPNFLSSSLNPLVSSSASHQLDDQLENRSINFIAPGKWSCSNCTYLNWLKSKFCIMCKVPRASLTECSVAKLSTNQTASSSSIVTVRGSMLIADSLWLKACRAVLYGNIGPVEQFLINGNIERRLNKQDCRSLQNFILNSDIKPQVTDNIIRPGLSLLDLALCCQHMDIFHLILSRSEDLNQSRSKKVQVPFNEKNLNDNEEDFSDNEYNRRRTTNSNLNLGRNGTGTFPPSRIKRTPCLASPIHAREIRRKLLEIIRQHKSDFACNYLNEWHTFALPAEILNFPSSVRKVVLNDFCDQQVQMELEGETRAINWWAVKGHKEPSRLYALWNRSSGDCLLDSVLQSCWGIFDRDNSLRQALAESIRCCETDLYPRWREYEIRQTSLSVPDYEPIEYQFSQDWRQLCKMASQPRESLEQFHVFVLAHLLRRPIIIYGVKLINNYRAEPIGIAHFQGIYLPLLWKRSFCSKTPIFLGYTKGHFTALVPQEPVSFTVNTSQSQVQEICSSDIPSSSLNLSRTASPARLVSHYSVDKQCSPPRNSSVQNSSAPKEYSENDPPTVCVPYEMQTSQTSVNPTQSTNLYLPLFDLCGELLPIHYTTMEEARNPRQLLNDWLDVVPTPLELPLCRMRLNPACHQVQNMTSEWLRHYREMASEHIQSQTDSITAALGPNLPIKVVSKPNFDDSMNNSASFIRRGQSYTPEKCEKLSERLTVSSELSHSIEDLKNCWKNARLEDYDLIERITKEDSQRGNSRKSPSRRDLAHAKNSIVNHMSPYDRNCVSNKPASSVLSHALDSISDASYTESDDLEKLPLD